MTREMKRFAWIGGAAAASAAVIGVAVALSSKKDTTTTGGKTTRPRFGEGLDLLGAGASTRPPSHVAPPAGDPAWNLILPPPPPSAPPMQIEVNENGDAGGHFSFNMKAGDLFHAQLRGDFHGIPYDWSVYSAPDPAVTQELNGPSQHGNMLLRAAASGVTEVVFLGTVIANSGKALDSQWRTFYLHVV